MTEETAFPDSAAEDSKKLRPKVECIKELIERCNRAKIELATDKVDIEDGNREQEFHIIKMPCGKGIRSRFIFSEDDYNGILTIEFEKYVYLENYEAISDPSLGFIEAAVRPIDMIGTRALRRKLFIGEQNEEELSIDIQRKPNDGNETISLGTASKDFNIMVRTRNPSQMTLKISNAKLSHHDYAINILEKTSNALFFQLDMMKGIALNLVRRRKSPGRHPIEKDDQREDEIIFPEYEYDSAPMSLYWYGRGATGMPLLQYLAYYQTLEYYFPIYSRIEAQRRARAIIKNPSFRPDRDSDIGYLLSSLLRVGGGFGDERSQLKATINECIDSRTLREFIESNDKIRDYLNIKSKLSDKKINLSNPNIDLRNDVADRIYDIRCKIVHAKSGTHEKDFELLLPFSSEAESLYYDIELLRIIAQKAIISASSPIRI